MKQTLIFTAALLLTTGLSTAYGADLTQEAKQETTVNSAQSRQTSLDYSDKANWMIFPSASSVQHPVDLFFLYPTCVSNKCKTDVGEVDEEMKHNAMLCYLRDAECMASYTNVYAPYHRQLSGAGIAKAGNAEKLEKACYDSVGKTDVFAALDYYFKHRNNGRPFILAGHSQGSCNLKIVLAEYMRRHPEYLKRMVACYAIGFYFPDSWFKANPHVKKAAGETDTGVLISWNCEAPGAVMPNITVNDGSFNINPLNWKTDETPAGIEENSGSAAVDPVTLKKTIVKGKVSAKINLKRGVLICEGREDHIPANALFGDKSFHFNDWDFFHENIRINGQKRIKAYFDRD